MQSKETKKWQDEEALKRFQLIVPFLDEGIDEGKRSQLREEIAEKSGLSKRSIYRYEVRYRDNAFDGLKQELFTSGAENEIYKVSAGIPRMK